MVLPCPECCPSPCVNSDDFCDDELPLWVVSGATAADCVLSLAGTAYFLPSPEPAADAPIKATILAAGSGTLRLVVAREDVDNFLFGELDITGGVGTIRVGQVVEGNTTYLSEPVELEDVGEDLEAEHAFAVCFTPGQTVEPVATSAFLLPSFLGTTGGWTTLNNALAADGNHAQFHWDSDTDPADAPGIAASFPLAGFIPPGSTIDGVLASAHGRHTTGFVFPVPAVEMRANLTVNGMQQGNELGPTNLPGPFGSDTTIGLGSDSSDPWNASLTWQDVANLGVVYKFRSNPVSGDTTAHIDWFGLEVFFTTPERTRGKITATFLNVGGEQTLQCAMSHDVFAATLGNGTGLEGSTWDLTSYHLAYFPCAEGTCECFPRSECEAVCADQAPGVLVVRVEGFPETSPASDGFTCDMLNGTYFLPGGEFLDAENGIRIPCGPDKDEVVPGCNGWVETIYYDNQSEGETVAYRIWNLAVAIVRVADDYYMLGFLSTVYTNPCSPITLLFIGHVANSEEPLDCFSFNDIELDYCGETASPLCLNICAPTGGETRKLVVSSP